MRQLGRRNQSDEDYLYLDAALDKNDLLEISLDDKLPIEKDFLQWRNLHLYHFFCNHSRHYSNFV